MKVKKETVTSCYVEMVEQFLKSGTYVKIGTDFPIYVLKSSIFNIQVYSNCISLEGQRSYSCNNAFDLKFDKFEILLDDANNLIARLK